MSVAKQELHENEAAIFAYRTEAGLQALRTWLYARQTVINTKWVSSNDATEVARLQGEAGLVSKLIGLIETGPRIKGETA